MAPPARSSRLGVKSPVSSGQLAVNPTLETASGSNLPGGPPLLAPPARSSRLGAKSPDSSGQLDFYPTLEKSPGSNLSPGVPPFVVQPARSRRLGAKSPVSSGQLDVYPTLETSPGSNFSGVGSSSKVGLPLLDSLLSIASLSPSRALVAPPVDFCAVFQDPSFAAELSREFAEQSYSISPGESPLSLDRSAIAAADASVRSIGILPTLQLHIDALRAKGTSLQSL